MGNLSHLDPAIQKVEFKLTVLAAEEARCRPCFEGAGPTAAAQGVLLRHQGPRALRQRPRAPRSGDTGRRRRLDRQVAAGRLATTKPAGARSTESGSSSTWWGTSRSPRQSSTASRIAARSRRSRTERSLGSLFSGKQEQLFADELPTGSRWMSSRCWARSTRASGTSSPRDSRTRSASRSGLCRTRLASSSSRSRCQPTKRDAQTAFRALLTGLEVGHVGDPDAEDAARAQVLRRPAAGPTWGL